MSFHMWLSEQISLKISQSPASIISVLQTVRGNLFETKEIHSTSTEYLGIKCIKHVYDYTLKGAKILLREIRTHNAGERIAMSVAELLS